MRQLKFFLTLIFGLISICHAQQIDDIARDLAQAQLEAYNARDIDAFLEPYSDSVKIYSFPSTLRYQGKDKMRERYGNMFQRMTDLHCKLENRIVMSNTVIDHELVRFSKDDPLVRAVAIYKVRNGKIQEVYFISEEK